MNLLASRLSKETLIDHLQLVPHPEGGFYRETYRSKGEINATALDSEYDGSRNHCTAIYFLLTADTFSAFHRIRQDEIWHFYQGDPIRIDMISEEGKHSHVIIGTDLQAGHQPQFVVPGGCWFASSVLDGGEFGLAGCTVAPGFDFRDFEMPSRDILLNLYPQHESIIRPLTRS